MKQFLLGLSAAAGGVLGWFFGPIDALFIALIVTCLVDYVTGVTCGVLGVSEKTKSHGLSSKAGFTGIVKKVIIFLLVGMLHFVEEATHVPIRDAAVMAFLVNELLSIVENCGLLGIPMPQKIKDMIEVLQNDNQS